MPATKTVAFSEAERELFFRSYAVCALWSSTTDNGDPLDAQADIHDISREATAQMREDCNAFIDTNDTMLRESGLSIVQMGHDFWLTRNGHGAGFWDRGIGRVGEKLTEAAKRFNAVELYIDEGGVVHAH